MREFAILDMVGNQDIEKNILSKLPKGPKVTIFSFSDEKIDNFKNFCDITWVRIPEDLKFHESKIRNFAYRAMMEGKNSGFVHFIDENVEITKEISPFLDSVEDLMDAFSLKSWFNTVCDQCNYVLTRYNPRMTVKIDFPGAKRLQGKNVHWCSNANTAWICVNLGISKIEDVLLDDRFDISMFYIIEFLARRRNRKESGDLSYMNMYPGIDEEIGTFRMLENKMSRQFSQKEFADEDKAFKETRVDIHPDMDIDLVMEDILKKIT